jgi:hypothetical protein
MKEKENSKASRKKKNTKRKKCTLNLLRSLSKAKVALEVKRVYGYYPDLCLSAAKPSHL